MGIFDNLLYKVVALLIACVLWAAAQGVTDVEQSFDIPVQVEKVPENLVVIEESAHEINLRVMGSRAALRQVAKNVQHYAVSFDGAKAGEARLAVNKEQITPPRGARIVASSPSTLVFALEAVSSKVCPCAPTCRAAADGSSSARHDRAEGDRDHRRAQRVRNVREVVTDRVDLSTSTRRRRWRARSPSAFPHVWRKDQSGAPIRIKIEIEPAAVPARALTRRTRRRRCASSSARMAFAGARTSTR
jgi:hypothetical protein